MIHRFLLLLLFSSCPIINVLAIPVVVRNLARGSALKCLADLTGGLPCEVWKSSVILEQSNSSTTTKRSSSWRVLQHRIQTRGVSSLWSGCSARMVEGCFSGAILLAAKESLRMALSRTFVVPPAAIGFVAGAGGGAAQALVMAPTSLLVTATTQNGGSVWDAAQSVWKKEGLWGIYRGSSAVAARQATNWASRQGVTEWVRPFIRQQGVAGEILAGCFGGAVSCWNTPFEVARVESQRYAFTKRTNNCDDGVRANVFGTMRTIVRKRGVGALYAGILPRIFQSSYQTIFLVCIPRLM